MPRSALRLAAVLSAAILVQPVLAQTAISPTAPANAGERPSPRSFLVTETVPGWASMCRANNAYYPEGEQACIRTSYGRRLAVCGKVVNVLNWEVSATSCPEP